MMSCIPNSSRTENTETTRPVSEVFVSAPGKVLLTGGYLILDPAYSGCVLATNARFYCRINERQYSESLTNLSRSDLDSKGQTDKDIRIAVRSPQFTDGHWTYSWSRNQLFPDSGVNPFVHSVLHFTLLYAYHRLGSKDFASRLQAGDSGLKITITADNDFYSQREYLQTHNLRPTSANLTVIPKQNHTQSTICNCHKTGLGSSAAMVTSLTAGLLLHLGLLQRSEGEPSSIDGTRIDTDSANLLHALAQQSHCFAQGKVGSGFDVSSAVFGSHLYTRFSPAFLESRADGHGFLSLELSDKNAILSLPNLPWDSQVQPFSLPPGFSLSLAEISAGSNTPKLVSSVLKWRLENPSLASSIYTKLNNGNQSVIEAFDCLEKEHATNSVTYREVLQAIFKSTTQEIAKLSEDSRIFKWITQVHGSFQAIRAAFQELTSLVGVPIEPPSQTRLLDACLSVPGVISAGVPGAGGFDAIFCIHLTDSSARQGLESLWAEWTETPVLPLLTNEGKAGILIHKTTE